MSTMSGEDCIHCQSGNASSCDLRSPGIVVLVLRCVPIHCARVFSPSRVPVRFGHTPSWVVMNSRTFSSLPENDSLSFLRRQPGNASSWALRSADMFFAARCLSIQFAKVFSPLLFLTRFGHAPSCAVMNAWSFSRL